MFSGSSLSLLLSSESHQILIASGLALGGTLKLVTEYLSAGEAEMAASNLEAAGIATFVSNSDSARIPVATSYAGGVGLWVVVDDQLWDAQQLLENPDHQVQATLTEAQQLEIRESVGDLGINGGLGLMFQLLGVTLLLVLVVFAVTQL